MTYRRRFLSHWRAYGSAIVDVERAQLLHHYRLHQCRANAEHGAAFVEAQLLPAQRLYQYALGLDVVQRIMVTGAVLCADYLPEPAND